MGPPVYLQWVLLPLAAHYVLSSLALRLVRGSPAAGGQVEKALGFAHCAHRGGSAERPENTLAAFDHAVAVGCQHLEMDVHLTADKRVVVHHDSSLLRMTGVAAAVRSADSTRLPKILPNPPLPPPYFPPGACLAFPQEDPTAAQEGERIPLLEEVLARYPPSVSLNIDVKVNSDELVEQVAQLVESHGRTATVVWGNFSEAITVKLRRRSPSVQRVFSKAGVVRLLLQYYTGVLPFCEIRDSHLELPLFTSEMCENARRGSWAHSLLSTQAFRVLRFLTTRKPLLRHLQARGVKVMYWVCNTEAHFEAALGLGADSICTDEPTRLARFLDEKAPGWRLRQ